MIYAIEYRTAILTALSIVYSSILYLTRRRDEGLVWAMFFRFERELRILEHCNCNIENRIEKIGITNVKVIIEITVEIRVGELLRILEILVIEDVGIIEMEIESRIMLEQLEVIEVEIRVKEADLIKRKERNINYSTKETNFSPFSYD